MVVGDLLDRTANLERQVGELGAREKDLRGSVQQTHHLVLRVVATQLLSSSVLILFVIVATIVGRVL